ncbi:transposase [Pseudothermotoga hypogea DSM 11164 = NBRC 106472]|uniref:Transposase n=1 Tax=Pseudothermotoga hypogea DSM 11164 = NBRC 106472 TaxID=1123384 RepID=A0A0X1KSP4_9THEM|nr:RNA-guided endonuclease TnpB family protein [Pseudothermotoga hypogea]AJC74319.1 transposase [Pseudothermotoga hypogea DSM 11164 = NBRC 106472]
MSRYIVRTYKVPVPRELYPLCSELNRLAGRIYNKTMSLVKKVKSKKGFWLSPGATQKYILRWSSTINIHTHSKQAIVQQYFQALNSYFTAVKTNPQLKPPHKKKRFMPFIWKDTAIKLSPEGVLRLSMGSSQEPILIQTTLPAGTTIRQVRLVYEAEKYYLHLAIEVKNEHKKKQSVEVMSVDLGILRPITCFDGSEVISYHGGILNSLIRYRNKKLADFQRTLSKCKKGSKRYRKLLKAKQRMLKRTKHQITDILHKITSNFLKMCLQKGYGTIVIGDITNIRERVEGNDNFNQKVHQWCFRKMVDMITYKAQLLGIEVKLASEEYTSQICPVCGSKNHAVGRNYECKSCGFSYHRDGVGAINIWQRYLGKKSQVVAGLAPVRGVRFKPHLCGHGVSNAPWKAA